jgi:hypothetical protein
MRNFIQQVRDRFGSSAKWRGEFAYAVNGYDFGPWEKNRVVDQGINYILNAALRGESVLSNFYIAPFVTNSAPAANLTAASFAATLTEFTNYSESARQAWVTDASASALVLENANAPALITIAGGAQTTIWGAALLSASPKSATSGVLVAAQKRSAALTVEEGFEIRIKYRILGSSS